MQHRLVFLGFLLTFGFVGCANNSTSQLEECQFALDASEFDSAIDHCNSAIEADDNNIQAYRYKGNAFFGRSNISFLDLIQEILTLNDTGDSDFLDISNVLPDNGDLDDLRSAITSIQDAPGIDKDDYGGGDLADAGFDLGLMQAIESYAIGIYKSGFKETGAIDLSLFDSDDKEKVQNDLLEFDDHLVAAGSSVSEGFITQIRQTFCILQAVDADEGFSLEAYEAYVGCQLDPDNFDPDTDVPDAGVADCSVFAISNQSPDTENCYDNNTSL